MNPLRQDDPRHVKAVGAASDETNYIIGAVTYILATYFKSLKEQGVVLVALDDVVELVSERSGTMNANYLRRYFAGETR